ncbi:protein phosphatase 2C domain-containing protein [Pseudonocardia alni]|uniref:protein phosphatase 2C domain-containing protein n=1 Tax=Pseudonocardia alni TaxID=33907 RepID=UPI0033346F06
MTVHGALLPGGRYPGQDRWRATPRGVVVLDGATASAPEVPPAELYVDTLLDDLARRLDSEDELPTVISEAIGAAADALALAPGVAPSSTVALLRWSKTIVEAAVLGDSTVVLGLADGGEVRLCDDRLSMVAPSARRAYHDRLRHGHGYDDRHRDLMTAIQRDEIDARNREHGYWIAEADPAAGLHAQTERLPSSAVSWAVVATDGAQRAIDHFEMRWADVAAKEAPELRSLLDRLHRWESESDPRGEALPRAKPHDDKTIVTWTPDRG